MALSVAQTILAALQRSELKELFGSDIESLDSSVKTLQAVLLDADDKQANGIELSAQEHDFIEKIKDDVYDADDFLDAYVTRAKLTQIRTEGRNKSDRKVRGLAPRFKSRIIGSPEAKKIGEKLDKIGKDAQNLKFDSVPIRIRRKETCSHVNENHIVGREDDQRRIVDMLLHPIVQSDDVLAIVGVGGLGKTALAQLVYNDPRIQKEFSLRLWVCVSDQGGKQFNLKAILADIYKVVNRVESIGYMDLDLLLQELKGKLDQNKYLLVLDDVWNEKMNECRELVDILIGSVQRGSRIVVTTRSIRTANAIGSSRPYKLQGLSDENSWRLFEKKIGREIKGGHDLFEVCTDIVQKCVNVPLAIKEVGCLLHDIHENEWQSFRQSRLLEIKKDDNVIMWILKFSYYHLSPSLKSCFTYCALFPRDFKIEKEALVSMWMAHGYVKDEDEAEYHFEILTQRCFFQEIEENYRGKIEFKIHGLMHDMAHEIAGKEIYIANSATTQLDKKIRHLYDDAPEIRTQGFVTLAKIRSYVHDGEMTPNIQFVSAVLAKWRQLRVLDLHEFGIRQLPDAIGELLHLRHLDLHGNEDLGMLPHVITNLVHLHFLNLDGCFELKELPRDFKKLVNLRTLYVPDSLEYMPLGVANMTSLIRLNNFIVGHPKSFLKQEDKLEDLRVPRNLKGSLHIRIKGDYKHAEEYCGEGGYICNTQHLNSISIVGVGNDEDLLEDLQPHRNLKKLLIEGYHGVRLPRWAREDSLTTSLPNLVRIDLSGCNGLEELPWLGRLQHLKTLWLWGLDNVEYMENRRSIGSIESSSMLFYPSLEKLYLSYMPNLKGWWRGNSNCISGAEEDEIVNNDNCMFTTPAHTLPSFPCLSQLSIMDCQNLTSIPLCPAVKSLKLSGNVNLPMGMRYLTSLKSLEISSLPLKEIPEWIECLSSLQSLRLSGCRYCHRLPPLGELPSLKQLEIEGMDNVTTVGPEFYGHNPTPFDVLESLSFQNMKGWKVWSNVDAEGNVVLFPRLRKLFLHDCPKLTGNLPVIPALTEEISIHGCEELAKILPQVATMHTVEVQDMHGISVSSSPTNDIMEMDEGVVHQEYFPTTYERGPSSAATELKGNMLIEDDLEDDLESEFYGSIVPYEAGQSSKTVMVPEAVSGSAETYIPTDEEAELGSCLSSQVEGSQRNEVHSLSKVNMDRPIRDTVKKILVAFRNKSRRICLYGKGGSGKSTVLRILSHHPAPKHLFDQIVFVSIPRFDRRRKMQSQIAQQLSLDVQESSSEDETAAQICNALTSRRRKVLLLLDDVWETMNLDEVGIPTGRNDGCWLVFTARYLDVSTDMASREIEMEVLSTVEAQELLRYKVGEIVDSPEIEPCARDIADECHGLPLIIIVVASALKMESSVTEWKLALSLFSDSSNSSNLFPATPHIKYCYDRLKDDGAKVCFLYCALFASDKEIDISVLVDCFFAEGLLGTRTSAAYKKGHDIVRHLVNASLLEALFNGCKVKMHNVIRDSALEILSSSTKGYKFQTGSYLRASTVPKSVMLSPNIGKYLTAACAQMKGPLPLEEWAQAEMICLMDSGLSRLPCKPSCPTLEALFLQRNNCLRVIPASFFDSMDALKILNLSETRIECLADSFSKLTSLKVLVLRDCQRLCMLPTSIGCLKTLEVLDLQGTELTHLPESVGELECLKLLQVSFYGSIYQRECSKLPTKLIPEGVISRLIDLTELGLFVHPGDQRWESDVIGIIEEISSLKLSALYFYFPDEKHLDHFLRGNASWKQGNISTFNFIVGHDFKHALPQVSYDVEMMHNGEERCLRFVNGENMPPAVLKVLSLVTSFYLDHHLNICNLSDYGIHIIETLKICVLRDCPQIRVIVDSIACSDSVFPILECLSINYAWNLERIWVGQVIPGSLARLRYLSLQSCPNLRYVLTCSMLDILHNLEELMIEDCESLDYIVIEDELAVDDATSSAILEKPCVSEISGITSGTPMLGSLKVLKLHNVPNLCGIWKGSWPPLEYISFYDCPMLKNLCMGENDAMSIKEIAADMDWWDNLQWDNEEVSMRLNECVIQFNLDDL